MNYAIYPSLVDKRVAKQRAVTSTRQSILRPMRRFRPFSALLAFMVITGCSNGTVARSEETAMPAEPQPLHHARRNASGVFENNYNNLPRASLLKWRWERWKEGLPKPPANGYASDGASGYRLTEGESQREYAHMDRSCERAAADRRR